MPLQDGQPSITDRWSTIEHYEAIAGASRRMLKAARAGRWDEVAQEEDRCRELISLLEQARAAGRAPVERARRIKLLRSILADDAQIRELSEPWVQQLKEILAPQALETQP